MFRVILSKPSSEELKTPMKNYHVHQSKCLQTFIYSRDLNFPVL